MTVKTLAELRSKFETGDTPSGQDFIDLLDSLLLADRSNFPNPLPAVSGKNLTEIGDALPDPLPARDGRNLTNINPSEYNTPAALPAPSYATANTFLLTGDWTATFVVRRRIELMIAGTPFYTDVFDVAFGAGVTTVTTYDNMPGNQLTAVKVSIFRPTASGGGMSPRALALDYPSIEDRSRLWIENAKIDVSVASNIVTISLKTEAGTDPTALDPVVARFRSATATSGAIVTRKITGALSTQIGAGSNPGSGDNRPLRIYVGLLDNNGAVELCWWNGVSIATGVSPTIVPTRWHSFSEGELISTTAENNGDGDSAGVMYSTTARASVAFRHLAYFEITRGVAPGTPWPNQATKIQMLGPGVPRTGDIIQVVSAGEIPYSAIAGANTIPHDNSIPQNTEGNQIGSLSITPRGALNLLEISANIAASHSASARVAIAVFRDATVNSIGVAASRVAAAAQLAMLPLVKRVFADATTASTFALRLGAAAAGDLTVNGEGGSQLFNGALNGFFTVTEICA